MIKLILTRVVVKKVFNFCWFLCLSLNATHCSSTANTRTIYYFTATRSSFNSSTTLDLSRSLVMNVVRASTDRHFVTDPLLAKDEGIIIYFFLIIGLKNELVEFVFKIIQKVWILLLEREPSHLEFFCQKTLNTSRSKTFYYYLGTCSSAKFMASEVASSAYFGICHFRLISGKCSV